MNISYWRVLLDPVIITIMAFLVVIIIIASRGYREDSLSAKFKDKFFKALDRKFDLGLIRDLNDINILIESVNLGKGYSSVLLLEEYLMNLLDDPAYQEKKEIILSKYELIQKIINLLKEEKPFSDVPNEERRILNTLKEAAARNDSDQVISNLNELSSVMIIRNKTYQRTAKLNRMAVPLAIISIIVTILFGIFRATNSINERSLKDVIKTAITDTLKNE